MIWGVVSEVVEPFAGPPVIATDGAVLSTAKSWVAGSGSGLPAASTALTANVCEPAGGFESV